MDIPNIELQTIEEEREEGDVKVIDPYLPVKVYAYIDGKEPVGGVLISPEELTTINGSLIYPDINELCKKYLGIKENVLSVRIEPVFECRREILLEEIVSKINAQVSNGKDALSVLYLLYSDPNYGIQFNYNGGFPSLWDNLCKKYKYLNRINIKKWKLPDRELFYLLISTEISPNLVADFDIEKNSIDIKKKIEIKEGDINWRTYISWKLLKEIKILQKNGVMSERSAQEIINLAHKGHFQMLDGSVWDSVKQNPGLKYFIANDEINPKYMVNVLEAMRYIILFTQPKSFR